MAGELRMEQDLKLNSEWAGFDLMKLGGQFTPKIYWRGDIVLVSGCITTVAPMKNQAGWDLTVCWVDPRGSPPSNISHLAPTAMSRYEGIYQCGTSMMLRSDGRITINFSKSTNPMVLHFSGLACVISHEEPIPIPIAQYALRDWLMQMSKSKPQEGQEDWALHPEESNPPALRKCGSYVFLQGELQEAVYGPLAQHVALLPEGFRPRREIRCLASLLRQEDDVVEHSVALTIRPNGTISVQGGKVHMVDAKGNMRVLQQKKKGRLCLSGVRFSLIDGVPVQPSHLLQQASKDKADLASGKQKVDYLMGTATNKTHRDRGCHAAGRPGHVGGPPGVVNGSPPKLEAAPGPAAAGLLAAPPAVLLHPRGQRPGGEAPRGRGPVRPHLLPRGCEGGPHRAHGHPLRGRREAAGAPAPAGPRLGRPEAAVPAERGELKSGVSFYRRTVQK
ncbi:unnamed protein product [Prorocentrum cordatum]|uniref:Altered inheritance of mitochondria protein 24, mitochondrial n=1 Tax=Prorocentrum cordatum TaxID=2364126 RepID=A0ABN9PEB1_9DINO|nr:unnamed protein product [Polarella glacialis]